VSDLPPPQVIEAYLRAMEHGWAVGEAMPRHLPGCYGCGDSNPQGLGLEVIADEGDVVRAEYTFAPHLQGAIGVAHGGAIAALLDDLLGYVPVRTLTPAVTRELTVTYHAPVPLGVAVELRARLDSSEGRVLRISGEVVNAAVVAVVATAVFITVDARRLVGG